MGTNCSTITDKFFDLVNSNDSIFDNVTFFPSGMYDYDTSVNPETGVPAASDLGTGATEGEIIDDDSIKMSYAADVAWTFIFSVMIVIAIIGNLVVFWIVLGKQRQTSCAGTEILSGSRSVG